MEKSGLRKWLLALAMLFAPGGAFLAQTTFAQTTPCAYTLAYTSLEVPPTGGNNYSVSLNTGTACGWTAAVDVPWITIVSGQTGTGSNTIGFTITSTNLTTSRVGHLTVQGQSLAITEVALLGPQAQVQQIWTSRTQVLTTVNSAPCTTAPGVVTAFSPTDAAAYTFMLVTQVNPNDVISTQYVEPNGAVYANAGGSYTVGSNVQSVCLEDQGMRIVGAPPAAITGAWTVNVSVNNVLVITTSFAIGGASSCTYNVSYTSLSVPPAGGTDYSVAVTTGSSCAWTTLSSVGWIIVTAGSTGTGSGFVTFSVGPNIGGSRTTNFVVAGQNIAVTQIATGGPIDQVTQIWMTHTPFPNSTTPCSDAAAAATTFAPTDAAAYLFLAFGSTHAGDVISDAYIAPDGSVYPSTGGTTTVPADAPLVCWEDPGLTIRGTAAANLTGAWTVNVQINGVLVITTSFTMLPGANCAYSIDSNSANYPAAGGTGTVNVTTAPGCSWTANTSASWVTITSGAAGTGNAAVDYSVAVNSAAARSGSMSIAGQTFTVNEASGLPAVPSISPGGVADPWTYTTGVAPGAWISIFGSDLANTTQSWSPSVGQPLATTLAGVSVTVDGIAAAPSYVSPTLVNVLAPAGIDIGQIQIVVTNNGLASAPYSIQSTQLLPAIYSNAAPGTSPPRYYVTAVNPVTNQLVGNPSADPRVTGAPSAGDTIDLYALGLGQSTPQFPTSLDFIGAYPVSSSVTVVIGGMSVTPAFADLVAPGLYQIRITVPSSLPAGDQTILLDFGSGVQSAQNVFLSLQR